MKPSNFREFFMLINCDKIVYNLTPSKKMMGECDNIAITIQQWPISPWFTEPRTLSEILNHVDIFPHGQLIPTHCTTYWVTLPHAYYKIIIFLEQKQASWTSYDKELPIQIPHHWQPPYHWQPPHDWVKFPLGTNKIPCKISPTCVLLLSGIVITRNKHSKYTRVIAIAFSLFLFFKIIFCLNLKYL
jgi:hypothetical protein